MFDPFPAHFANMPHAAEMVKQKLGFGSGFVPTHNDRTKAMYKELTAHAKLIKGLQKQTTKLHKATDGMLGMVEKAFSVSMPRDYDAQTDGQGVKATPKANEAMDEQERSTKTAEITAIRGELEARLQEAVFQPSNAYLDDVMQPRRT